MSVIVSTKSAFRPAPFGRPCSVPAIEFDKKQPATSAATFARRTERDTDRRPTRFDDRFISSNDCCFSVVVSDETIFEARSAAYRVRFTRPLFVLGAFLGVCDVTDGERPASRKLNDHASNASIEARDQIRKLRR